MTSHELYDVKSGPRIDVKNIYQWVEWEYLSHRKSPTSSIETPEPSTPNQKQKCVTNRDNNGNITANLESIEKAKALEAAEEKRASSWLNTLPLKTQGYALDKPSFCDAVLIPSHCDSLSH